MIACSRPFESTTADLGSALLLVGSGKGRLLEALGTITQSGSLVGENGLCGRLVFRVDRSSGRFIAERAGSPVSVSLRKQCIISYLPTCHYLATTCDDQNSLEAIRELSNRSR